MAEEPIICDECGDELEDHEVVMDYPIVLCVDCEHDMSDRGESPYDNTND